MNSATHLAPPPQASLSGRLRALATAVLGTVIFLVVVGALSRALRFLLQSHVNETLQVRAALTIAGSALGEFAVLGLLVVYLRARSQSLDDFGFRKNSPLRGWLLAGLMTLLYVSVVFTSVLRNQSGMTQVSLFRISTSLAAGLSAGIVEEVFFRGFIMSQLKWSGFGSAVQVVLSGVCFGIAHVGWGLLSARPQVGMAVGAMVTTSILGILYALVYLSSRRSLLPVMVGHGLMDFLIEPWLIMATLGTATSHLH